MVRGEIRWADLPDPVGAGPGYRRPVIVIQSDDFNRSRIATVMVVAITSNLRLAEAPGNVLLPRGETGLPRDSVANVSQVVTIGRAVLAGIAGTVARRLMSRVGAGLRLALGL